MKGFLKKGGGWGPIGMYKCVSECQYKDKVWR